MSAKEMYERNDKFKEYVDRYARDNDITCEEALQRAIVLACAECLLNPGEKLDWVLGK